MESADPPEPKPPNITTPQSGPFGKTKLTTSGMDKDNSSDRSKNKAPGHQGVKTSGGINADLRVLVCTNVDLSLDYEGMHQVLRRYGKVERLKMKLASGNINFDCYATFENSSSANEACMNLRGHSLNDSVLNTRLFNIRNLEDEVYDFIPKILDESGENEKARKNKPILTWHVATFKEGSNNMLKASEVIQNKVGNIPFENLKRYGKNLLIKAGNATQATLLSNFKPSENGNVQNITPHKTFNTLKGVVFCKDLYDFSEEEILERCPSFVIQAKKLRGSNNTILLTFSSSYLPDHIIINHSMIKVKRARANPKQCHNCFEYGHILKQCQSRKRCYVCSAEHDVWDDDCTLERYCFHCKGSHSPNSRECPRHLFEQEVLEVANNQYISIGSAKKQVMGANKHREATYASAIGQVNNDSNARRTSASDRSNSRKEHNIPTPQSSNISESKGQSESSMLTEMEFLPDLAEAKECENPSMEMGPSEPNNSCESQDAKAFSIEMTSSVAKVTKKTEKDKDGFVVPSVRKRSRPVSPKKNSCEIKTSNSFSGLEGTPLPKKQAVSEELEGEKRTVIPKTRQPKIHTSGKTSSNENQSESVGVVASEPTKKGEKIGSISETAAEEPSKKATSKTSRQKFDLNDPRRNKPLKMSSNQPILKNGSSQPEHAKVGKTIILPK